MSRFNHTAAAAGWLSRVVVVCEPGTSQWFSERAMHALVAIPAGKVIIDTLVAPAPVIVAVLRHLSTDVTEVQVTESGILAALAAAPKTVRRISAPTLPSWLDDAVRAAVAARGADFELVDYSNAEVKGRPQQKRPRE